jgi:hypothetical protein
MKTWTTPIVNTLKSADAISLQQIFSSLSQEIGQMYEEIEKLKMEVNKNNRKDYQRIR